MFIIMRNAVTAASQLNIGAHLGIEMFAFMWIAAGASLIAFIIQIGQCCCCASRRDVRAGRKRGSKKAWADGFNPGMREKGEKKRGSSDGGRERSPGRLGSS